MTKRWRSHEETMAGERVLRRQMAREPDGPSRGQAAYGVDMIRVQDEVRAQ